MYIIFVILLYFYIGYTYVCWVNYREGAGFEVHDFALGMMNEVWGAVILLWPIGMIVHAAVVIYDKFSLERFASKISPLSFYKRGKVDNDPNIQAERHLLGRK